jgi:hypothetical protein
MSLNSIPRFLLMVVLIICHQAFSKIAVSGVEDQYSFSALQRDPYVSGSLQYNSANATLSQLNVGTKIPVRLGRLIRTQIPADDLPADLKSDPNYKGQAIYEYEDNGSAVEYGYINILSIDVGKINFNSTIYKTDGSLLKNFSVTVMQGKSADLDGDGKADVEYVSQINSTRPTNTTIRYLRFITLETSLTSNTYCYMPEYLPTQNYANGLMGFNQDGNAIIRPTAKTALGKVALAAGTVTQIGDLIMDTDNGIYRRIIASTSTVLAKRNASLSDLSAYTTPIDNVSQVFAVVEMKNSQSNFALVKASAGIGSIGYPTMGAFQAAQSQAYQKMSEYQFTFPIPEFPGMITLVSGVRVGIDKINARIGLDADLDITWRRVKGKVGGMVMITGTPTFSGGAQTNFISEKNRDISIPMPNIPGISFPIGPIMVTLSIVPEMGCTMNIFVKRGTKITSSMFVATGFTSSLSIGWTGASGSSDGFAMGGLYTDFDMQTSVETGAYIRPYIGIGPRVDIMGTLYAQLTARKWIGPEWSTVISSTKRNYATTNMGLYVGRNFTLKMGARVGISFFGQDFYKSWEPINNSYAEVKEPLLSFQFDTPLYIDSDTKNTYTGVSAVGAEQVVSQAVKNHGSISPILSLLLDN